MGHVLGTVPVAINSRSCWSSSKIGVFLSARDRPNQIRNRKSWPNNVINGDNGNNGAVDPAWIAIGSDEVSAGDSDSFKTLQ